MEVRLGLFRSLAAVAAPAAEQFDLQQADRVDVGIAQADRQAQARVAAQQGVFVADRLQRVAGARELRGDAREQRAVRVAGQARVAFEDRQVRLGQRYLISEERRVGKE